MKKIMTKLLLFPFLSLMVSMSLAQLPPPSIAFSLDLDNSIKMKELAQTAILCLNASAIGELKEEVQKECADSMAFYNQLETLESKHEFLMLSGNIELADNTVNIERCTVNVLNNLHTDTMPSYCINLYRSNLVGHSLREVKPIYINVPTGGFWIEKKFVTDFIE